MKRSKLVLIVFTALLIYGTEVAKAQDYKNEIGLGLDFGNGATLLGPSYKHFFNSSSTIQIEFLFGDHFTVFNAFYLYHGRIKGADGLKWYAGGGPAFNLYLYTGYNKSTIALKPMAGFSYKVASTPVALTFDWRPTLYMGLSETNFEAARFGFGLRYTLK